MHVSELNNTIGYLLIYFSLGIGLAVLNFHLAELARKAWGQFFKWFVGFFFLPVLSHIYFIYRYNHHRRQIAVKQAAKREERVRERRATGKTDEEIASKGKFAVTPFDLPDTDSSESAHTESAALVSEIYRDPVVEELINWGQYSKALDLIEVRLEISRKKLDTKMVDAYATYRQFIRNKQNLT